MADTFAAGAADNNDAPVGRVVEVDVRAWAVVERACASRPDAPGAGDKRIDDPCGVVVSFPLPLLPLPHPELDAFHCVYRLLVRNTFFRHWTIASMPCPPNEPHFHVLTERHSPIV